MPVPNPMLIADVRRSSRALVRAFGFLDHTLAGTDLSPSAVHAVVETGLAGRITASELTEKLGLEKSTTSRLLASLIKRGEITVSPNPDDGRSKFLTLTRQGKQTAARINVYAETQVRDALGRLSEADQHLVAGGIETYARVLGGAADTPALTIEAGYTPGIIGRMIEMHLSHYGPHAGFGAAFEARLAKDMSEFTARLDNEKNQIWSILRQGRVAGSIAIDGEDLGDKRAHLRWFIVDDGVRGLGAGKRLLGEALSFCDAQGFETVDLWTLRGLEAARALYEANGFQLVEEFEGDQWGRSITEQRFRRHKPA